MKIDNILTWDWLNDKTHQELSGKKLRWSADVKGGGGIFWSRCKTKTKNKTNVFTSLTDGEDIYQAVMISGLWEQISVTSAWAAFEGAAVLVLPPDGTHVLL